MSTHPRNRLATVLFALASLLFYQWTLAAYSCPDSSFRASEMAAMAYQGMPCAESMGMSIDTEQPNVCHAHCQASPQTASTYQMPVLASLPDVGANYLIPRMLPAPPGAPLQAPLLRRTTAPPLAIQNCCFRI